MDVMLQIFITKEEYKRVTECATRCCKLKLKNGPMTPGSPGSPSRVGGAGRGEPMVCKITEVSLQLHYLDHNVSLILFYFVFVDRCTLILRQNSGVW